jgi:DNA-directed RNA polymerase specialized sigma24 family protein
MRKMLPSVTTSRSMMAAVVLGTALTAAGVQDAIGQEPTTPVSSGDFSADAVQGVSKYCQACWRNARLPIDRWTDCTQQVLVRLLESVPQSRWNMMLRSDGEEKREFIRAIDTVKKRTQRSKRYGELTNDVTDCRNLSSTIVKDQLEAVRIAADRVLNSRQRLIVEMSATGWAVPEIATELGTTPERVSDEKYKAIRKLRSELGVEA